MIYILIEGNDDERLFSAKIKPEILNYYDYVKFIKWTHQKRDYIDRYIKSIKSMESDYIFIHDFNNSPCIANRKEKIKNAFKSLDENRIFIIVQEIESWYLAGLDEEASKNLKIKNLKDTNFITKEQFNKLKPNKFHSRIDFMKEVLKNFSIETAKIKNKSFKYFFAKHIGYTNCYPKA